ncbi:hypothetical protein IFR05_013402 [Cadophora sp. M221]|nr:hypothetical protein IFR05_013402 [Cadophora sp. M221]
MDQHSPVRYLYHPNDSRKDVYLTIPRAERPTPTLWARYEHGSTLNDPRGPKAIIPVDFNGKTLYVNSAAIVDSSAKPAKKAARSLLRRAGPDNDTCGPSSFDSHPGPYPTTRDCGVIRDWAFTQNTYWGVWTNTPDTWSLVLIMALVYLKQERGMCITSTSAPLMWEISRVMPSTFGRFGGLIAAQGNMGCDNDGSLYDGRGQSSTNWKIKHS